MRRKPRRCVGNGRSCAQASKSPPRPHRTFVQPCPSWRGVAATGLLGYRRCRPC
ncbi:hypothetical protein [Lysobacter gummosus]|uniref:hypothetical protein n=1 Tax=Lysobacter gummosus TaxID=262324 RepID=UPI0036253929